MEQPKEYRIDNGCFVGFVLVEMPPETNAMGMKQKPEDGWMPFAIDLREVNEIRQADHDNPDRTSLYHNGSFIGCVNVSFPELLPHWSARRHVYERPQGITCAK